MRKLLSKSPEFMSQGFSLDNASAHPAKLSGHLENLKEVGNNLRGSMCDLSLKELCDLTDIAVLRTASRGA